MLMWEAANDHHLRLNGRLLALSGRTLSGGPRSAMAERLPVSRNSGRLLDSQPCRWSAVTTSDGHGPVLLGATERRVMSITDWHHEINDSVIRPRRRRLTLQRASSLRKCIKSVNEIAPIGNQHLTMSSREIAELVQSRHDSVKRTIERCASKQVITLPPLVETTFTGADGRSQSVSVYNLNKRDSFIFVAQLCPEFTARLVDRWQYLESRAVGQHFGIPQTLPCALLPISPSKSSRWRRRCPSPRRRPRPSTEMPTPKEPCAWPGMEPVPMRCGPAGSGCWAT